MVGLVCLAAASPAYGAASVQLAGAITGTVTDGAGVPQMGAAVLLFNRQDRLFHKVLTDDKGAFVFAGLLPDVYSIRVTLASFVPAIKDHILVQPGMRSVLNVSMATLFSSIQLSYPSDHPAFMSDDWKWALRTATATRPVTRLLPEATLEPSEEKPHHAAFSDTRGLVMFSAGDGSLVAGFGNSADMGTAFAVATSLFGSNQLQVAGNVGSGTQSGMPSAAFRTSYSRQLGPADPELSVTMRELFLPTRMGVAIFGGEGSVPMLRNISTSLDDHSQIGDSLSLQYGSTLDIISFNDHLGYFSPYARLTYTLDKNNEVDFDFTSGNARPGLQPAAGAEDQLQRGVNSLGLFPVLSLKGGRTVAQRGQDLEVGYSHIMGSRRLSLGVYHQAVRDLSVAISQPEGFLPVGDVLPDFFSGTAMFDAGNFSSMGYIASFTQNVGDNVSATVIYGSTGTLTADRGNVVSNNPDELRAMIHAGRQQSVTFRVAATSPRTGTRIMASYQVADNSWELQAPIYSTRNLRPEPGLNIYVRQPIPGLSVLPWRMEVTADLRNLLQQGALPLPTADGRQLTLVETPRMVRGGLSFIF